jgi:hypothetical protein
MLRMVRFRRRWPLVGRQYAGVACLVTGAYVACLGITIILSRLEEGKALWDEHGLSESAALIVVGIPMCLLSIFVYRGRNWARWLTIVLLAALMAMGITEGDSAAAQAQSLRHRVALKVAGLGVTLVFPGLLWLFLLNAKDEFVARKPATANADENLSLPHPPSPFPTR